MDRCQKSEYTSIFFNFGIHPFSFGKKNYIIIQIKSILDPLLVQISNSRVSLKLQYPAVKMADAPAEITRPMKYPYTFSAKVAQFPFKHYIKNQWIWRYYLVAVGCCIPVFYKISKLGNYNCIMQG